MKLFVDLDGVLADFDTEYFRVFREPPRRDQDEPADMWERIKDDGTFFLDMRPMADAFRLWNFLIDANLAPTILTGCPQVYPDAANQKRAWVNNYFGNVPVITCRSKEKSLHMQPGDVLIDDWEKYRHLWEAKGGRWITHVSAQDTITQLFKAGICK